MYNKPKIIIENNKIDITNFTDIDHFDSNKIILKINNNITIVYGYNLIISRLVIDEVLIEGTISKIEFR